MKPGLEPGRTATVAIVVDEPRCAAFAGQVVHPVSGTAAMSTHDRAGVDRVFAALSRIDILVNNAGFATLSPVETMDVALWDAMIGTHLRGAFLVTRFVLPGMLAQGDGRIINLSSQLAQIGREDSAHYAAAKAGIIGFSKSPAREVSAHGVFVNCIAPGPIATGSMPNIPAARRRDDMSPLPIPRIGQVEEVAPTAVFLASVASTYYSGQTLCPNGGDVMLSYPGWSSSAS